MIEWPLAMQVLHVLTSSNALAKKELIDHASAFARSEVLQEGFQGPPGKAPKDAAQALRSHELALLQV